MKFSTSRADRTANDATLLARAAMTRIGMPPKWTNAATLREAPWTAASTEALAGAAPMICQENHGFDRTAFHRVFDRDVVRFFERALPRNRSGATNGARSVFVAVHR